MHITSRLNESTQIHTHTQLKFRVMNASNLCRYIQKKHIHRQEISCQNTKGYVSSALLHQEGDVILSPPRGFQYIGWLLVRGNSPREAQACLEACMRDCVVFVEEG